MAFDMKAERSELATEKIIETEMDPINRRDAAKRSTAVSHFTQTRTRFFLPTAFTATMVSAR